MAASALVLAGAVIIPLPAYAADGPFSIDGSVPDAGTTELGDVTGNDKELGPLNSNSTKIGVIHSDGLPTLGLTNPNAQVDLRRAWLDTERDTAAPSHDWLYFAWERDNNSGSGFIAYEFMQDPAPAGCAYDTATDAQLIASCNPWANRRAGDFMILWDQQGNSLDLYLRTWTGTAPNLTLGAPTLLNAAVSQAAYSADGFRGEAAVDLTATIFGGSTACKSFANTIPSTVTGNSDTADYKDTILTTTPPITNCTSTTVTTPKTGAGATIPAEGLSIGTGVVAVKDSALVSVAGGTATPAGSVAFFLCKVDAPGLCTPGGTSVGSTNLTGAAYPVTVVSPTAYVTSVGRYCWRAVFSGDSDNGIPGSSDSSATECFTVNPVTPSLGTTASADVLLGNTVSDSATLGGTATQPANPVINLTGTAGAPAGGTITFRLYGPGDCTTLAYTSASGHGQRQRHVRHAQPAVRTDLTRHLPLGRGLRRELAEHEWHDAQRCVQRRRRGRRRQHRRLVDEHGADVGSQRLGADHAPAAGGNLGGKVYFTLYAARLHGHRHLQHPSTGTVAGASPQVVNTSNSTAVGREAASPGWSSTTATTRPRGTSLPKLSRDVVPDDHQRRDGQTVTPHPQLRGSERNCWAGRFLAGPAVRCGSASCGAEPGCGNDPTAPRPRRSEQRTYAERSQASRSRHGYGTLRGGRPRASLRRLATPGEGGNEKVRPVQSVDRRRCRMQRPSLSEQG